MHSKNQQHLTKALQIQITKFDYTTTLILKEMTSVVKKELPMQVSKEPTEAAQGLRDDHLELVKRFFDNLFKTQSVAV